MPSHIFTRLGLWQESIESNLASAAAAKSYMAKTLSGATSQDQLHAMDYLAYAYLQTCQDEKAKRIVDEAASVSRVDQQVFQAAYAFAAIPARYALERRRWSAAAALQVRPAWFPWTQFRYAEAITHFARALGSARSGNIARRAGRNRKSWRQIEQTLRQHPRGLRLVCASRSAAAYCIGLAQTCGRKSGISTALDAGRGRSRRHRWKNIP